MDALTEIFNPKRKVNATIEVYDIPGLRTSNDCKLKITNNFLNEIKNNDALFYVTRQFDDNSVPHPLNNIDPLEDIKFLENEFLFHDLAFLESRLEKLRKELMKTKDERLKKELPVLEKCFAHLESEKPLRKLDLEVNEAKLLSGYQLITSKELVIAINFDDDSINNSEKIINEIKKFINDPNVNVIPYGRSANVLA